MPAGTDAVVRSTSVLGGWLTLAGPDRLLAYVELDAALQSTDRPVLGRRFRSVTCRFIRHATATQWTGPVRGWVRILGKSDRSSNRHLAESSSSCPSVVLPATLPMLPKPRPLRLFHTFALFELSPSEDFGRMLGLWDTHDATNAGVGSPGAACCSLGPQQDAFQPTSVDPTTA